MSEGGERGNYNHQSSLILTSYCKYGRQELESTQAYKHVKLIFVYIFNDYSNNFTQQAHEKKHQTIYHERMAQIRINFSEHAN